MASGEVAAEDEDVAARLRDRGGAVRVVEVAHRLVGGGFGEAVDALPAAAYALALPEALRSLAPRPTYARAPDAKPKAMWVKKDEWGSLCVSPTGMI